MLGAATSASAKSKDKGKAPAKSKAKDDELYPLVEFFTPQGKEIVLVVRDEFRAEDNEGKLLARRVQIPLVLAWAMSIHKSQGQTIERVKIDLRRVFERGASCYYLSFTSVLIIIPGQSYVALSRAASMDGLQVIGFDATKVFMPLLSFSVDAHQKVRSRRTTKSSNGARTWSSPPLSRPRLSRLENFPGFSVTLPHDLID